MSKSADEYFRDWEASTFGYGYGTGEPHTLLALKLFLAAIGRDDADHGYDYRQLEKAVSPTVAWLLINILAQFRVDIIEYGTSPRFGWLTKNGERLRGFVRGKSVDELIDICCAHDENYIHCDPDHCNCDEPCHNPFWST